MSGIRSLFSFGEKKDSKKKKTKTVIPATATESIPYKAVYENGVVQLDDYTYSKAYVLNDINFSIESDEQQKQIIRKYMEFLSSFGDEVNVQILVYNKTMNTSEFEQLVLIQPRQDGLNEYREEINDMLISKMASARNNIVHEKYVVISLEADDIEDANSKFIRVDLAVTNGGKQLTGAEFKPQTIKERLETLYSIYNMDSTVPLYQKMYMRDGRISESYTLKQLKDCGMKTKDLIAPPMRFEYDYFMFGDTYGRALFLRNLPTILRADFMTELSYMPFNMLTSIHYRPLQQNKSLKMIQNKLTDINGAVVTEQKKAFKRGYSPDLISPKITEPQISGRQLLNDITNDNLKLYMTSLCVTVFAQSKEQLDINTKIIQSTAERFICDVQKLSTQQELGVNSCLPLGKSYISVERLLHTAAAAAFNPFSVKEVFQKNGFYYGLNAMSKQLILYDRFSALNGNGCIFGTSGAGKSFMAKLMILQVILNTDDEIFVIDAEHEYTLLSEIMHGSVIRLAPGSGVYLNPMDMDLKYSDNDDPITLKADFISSLCEAAVSNRYPLSPIMRSVIDRCVKNVYLGYVEQMRAQNLNFDNSLSPTMADLYEELLKQDEPEAHNMALSLERFVSGTQDCFARKTTVDINNRFTVFDIKDLGDGMMNIGLQVCLDNIWNRMIANWRRGKRTWIFCDEFHLLTQTETSAKYVRQIWKRARKWNGVPTGMTQQVEDMLRSAEGRAVINNCDFLMMLNLDPYSRMQLQQMYGLSDKEMEYVSGVGPGQGLIYTGTDIIPFVNEFPQDTKLYKVMTTKPDDKVS